MVTPRPPSSSELERVEVTSRQALRRWLARHHLDSPGIWLVTYKKSAGKKHLGYDAIVEELLCFGWVDSKGGKVDDARTMLLCTPRKAKSAWSQKNKERVERLQAAGLMAEQGLALVRLAQETGTWDVLNDVEALVTPPDLEARLSALPDARAHWDAFPRSVKRGILEWILQAKRPETRAKRVEETATRASRNERANQWR